MTLTQDQILDYHEQGYTLVEDMFPQSELDAMNEELDRLMDEGAGKDAHGKGWIMQLGLVSKTTEAFCADDRILDLIAPLVYPGIAIFSSKLVSKEPNDDAICHWHQDDAYYTKHSQSEHRMSIWTALQDTIIEHGCLEVIPGSHKRSLQPTSTRKEGLCTLAMDIDIDMNERVFCPVKAGTMILFSSLLWHGSAGNRTNQRRRAFIVSFQEATVPGGNGRQWKILRTG
jgi:ectoine hydroxylase-related dioxygenase (phytanoyl-CoA dioxygenase family)